MASTTHELELHDGRYGQHQPRALSALDRDSAGLEGGGLVGVGPLGVVCAGHTLASRPDLYVESKQDLIDIYHHTVDAAGDMVQLIATSVGMTKRLYPPKFLEP